MSLLDQTVTAVSARLGVPAPAILRTTRGRSQEAWARAVAMHVYHAVSEPPMTLTKVGQVFDRDRTTVRHALARVRQKAAEDRSFATDLEDLCRRSLR